MISENELFYFYFHREIRRQIFALSVLALPLFCLSLSALSYGPKS